MVNAKGIKQSNEKRYKNEVYSWRHLTRTDQWHPANGCVSGTYWLYAGISVLGISVFTMIVPETKGKSLEEIEQLFSKGWCHCPCMEDSKAIGSGKQKTYELEIISKQNWSNDLHSLWIFGIVTKLCNCLVRAGTSVCCSNLIFGEQTSSGELFTRLASLILKVTLYLVHSCRIEMQHDVMKSKPRKNGNIVLSSCPFL